MTLLHRRILTLFLFILLIIVGPSLIFYGAGYRFDFKQKRLQRVGLLHITTDPENTTITVDGQSHPVPDELVLSSLRPKEYDIILSKEGYHPWYKRLEIAAGESTFIRELNLFLDQPEELIASIPASATFLYSDETTAYFQSTDELISFNFRNETIETAQLANSFEPIHLRSSGDLLTFQQNSLWYTYNGQTISVIDLSSIAEPVIDLVAENRTIYFLTESGIWNAPLDAPEEAELTTKQLFTKNLEVFNSTIWFLASEPSQKHSFLYRVINEQSRPELIATLNFQTDYEINSHVEGFLSIYSPSEKSLILVDANTLPPTTKVFDRVEGWEWSADNNQLLLATEFELLILHFNDNQRQELLMRLSTPFEDTAWETRENHAFYLTEDTLHLVERDERQQRNTISLIKNQGLPSCMPQRMES